MINPNELRTGNLVYDNKILRKVTGIKLDELGDCVKLDDIVTNRLIKNIEPIPLTPEILEKAGFVGFKNSKVLYLHSEHGVNDNFIYYSIKTLQILDKNLKAHWIVPCEYLHQLQNLYFALTGEELEVLM